MSLLLETKSMPALIIKPILILVAYEDDLSWKIKSNQAAANARSSPQLDFLQTKCYSRADPAFYNCIPVDLMFKENFPPDTQVWNSLSHQNDFRQRGVFWVLWVLKQHPVLGQEHQLADGQVFHLVHGTNRKPTDRNQTQLRSQRLQHHDDLWL